MHENINQGNYNSTYLNVQQQRFAKNRNGYIFPVNYIVRPISEDLSKFFVNIEADLLMKGTVFVFTDNQFNITDISSSAISHFDLTSSSLKKDIKINICDIVTKHN